MLKNKIIIIDGECAFCNRSAAHIHRRNKKNDIWFAASQSENGKKFIQELNTTLDPKKTIIYLRKGKIYDRSSAVIQISKSMSGIYPLFIIFWIIPKFIRDAVYNVIAKRRLKIIAKEDQCDIQLMNEFKGRII